MFNIHAYTNKSTFDIRKKLNLLLVKKEKERNEQTNITVYILRTISLFIGNNHFFYAYFTIFKKKKREREKRHNITDK